ncbi:hypothetical protein Q7P37_007609 [Cladosporium fusiforme]
MFPDQPGLFKSADYSRVNLPVATKVFVFLIIVYFISPWLLRQDYLGIKTFYSSLEAFGHHRLLSWSAKRFDDERASTLAVKILGVDVIVTMEPRNLQTILALESRKWGLGERRKRSLRPLLGDGIFTTDGTESMHSRAMLRPNFAATQIADMAGFERHFARWVAGLPWDSSTVDLAGHFFRLTIDFAVDFLFGRSVESLTGAGGKDFDRAFDSGQNYAFRTFRFGAWISWLGALLGRERYREDRSLLYQLVDRCVDEAYTKTSRHTADEDKRGRAERHVILDELARRTANRVRVRSELLNVLLAGRDTTASLLTNVWFVLSKRTDIWAKLQDEVGALHEEPPTFAALKEMNYLRALLRESLRLHPVVPQNYREALEDATLPVGSGPDGSAPLFIPKGKVVAWSVYAMHRRKDYYGEDADEFRPERWLDDAVAGKKGIRPRWEYLPFNGGPRMCLGQQHAMLQASYTTVRLCQVFSGIESRDPSPVWREKLHFTCLNMTGAKVSLTPRRQKPQSET